MESAVHLTTLAGPLLLDKAWWSGVALTLVSTANLKAIHSPKNDHVPQRVSLCKNTLAAGIVTEVYLTSTGTVLWAASL